MSEGRRIVIYVDVDAFYASVEAHANPSLRGLPLVIGADPEGGKGRGVVVACSYGARKYGVKSGMPISKAYRLCPDAAYVRPNLGLYGRVSIRIMNNLRRHADLFEQAAIDEAFLDVSSSVKGLEEAKRLAWKIKREIFLGEGLTCSIGIGPNKSSAKIASDTHKPDGLTVVPFDDVEGFLAPLPVSVIPGIGRKTRAFLEERSIRTVAQLQEVPGKQLPKWFGRGGVWLWGVVHGKEMVPVRPRGPPKSLNVELTFRRDIRDFNSVLEHAGERAEELFRRLTFRNLQFRTAGVKIRFRGFETYTREKSFVDYSDSLDTLKAAVRSLLQEFKGRDKAVRMVGVRVSDLRRIETRPSTLDSWA